MHGRFALLDHSPLAQYNMHPNFKGHVLDQFLLLWLLVLLFRYCFALFIHLVHTLLRKRALN